MSKWMTAWGVSSVLLGFGPAHAGGVTLITHGFNGNVTDWVIPMGEVMMDHPGFDGDDISCYEMEIRSVGGGLQASMIHLGGPVWNAVESGEIVIKLDWSSEAGFSGSSSSQVASATANALRDPALLDAVNGRALAELPLHLVGHSRGSSVVTEIARYLGERGVWVDQVTALDPVPVGLFGDDPVRSWENVLYMESYWQEIGGFLVPTGQPISGAYNRELTNLSGGYSSAHSDAHLWYHGTIDLSTPATDTQATIGSSQRSAWWTAAENEGADTGFLYSRIGGGDRTSTAQPGGAPNQVRDGFNQSYDFGVSGDGNRSLLDSKTDVWPNPIIARRTGAGALEAGTDLEVQVYYQDGASALDPELTVSLDPDRNPWNGNEVALDTFTMSSAGKFGVLNDTRSADTSGVAAGSYAVLMTLSQGGKERHFHAVERVEITVAPMPVEIVAGSAGLVDGLFSFEVSGDPGTEIAVEASDDMDGWDIVATQILGSGNWVFSDPDTGLYGRRFYRLVEPAPAP